MSKPCFHASIEGAQHGAKTLDQFLAFAKSSGAAGAQPSNYMLQEGSKFKTAKEIQNAFDQHGLKLDGISAHCPFWVHTTAWTASPTVRPFIPAEVAALSPEKIEAWAESYVLRLLELCQQLGVKILPMFWGTAFGWETASGYPWGFWNGPGYDLIKEGGERFASKTAKIRQTARQAGIFLAHEIHPGTAAMTAEDFLLLVKVCDGDPCLTVNADPSHCWEGESWEDRFRAISDRVLAAHVKNYTIRPGIALRKMAPDWKDRAMQFVDLASGDLSMPRYVEMLIGIGYPARYCRITGSTTAPLVVEAESAYRGLDATSAAGIAYTRDHLCFPVAEGSFEDGMGA
ncbi:MAG: sugar phosphate isomerase/epimerase [Candidatus Methylacidiphilales bacterium]|nr:sugar phosphate isomerase/epimerase [Candidatus Methylacidiphilales bacterium]